MLTRVNSLLLAPQVALTEAGIAVRSTLSTDVLERTGIRAALAYLRLGSSPDRLQPADLQEVLRRPSRGFPNWIGKWMQRPLSITDLRGVATRIDDAKIGAKVAALADDLEAVAAAVASRTTREALAVVADDVGLGGAMSLLDGSKGGQTASQLDDLDALAQVADLHPDPSSFERWLREVLAVKLSSGPRVTLSTVHRVKGMEWDRVVVAGVTAGVLPHRLADDEEEERRVLHVAISLRPPPRHPCSPSASRPSVFLGELDGSAPATPRPPAEQCPQGAGERHPQVVQRGRPVSVWPSRPMAASPARSPRSMPRACSSASSGVARSGCASGRQSASGVAPPRWCGPPTCRRRWPGSTRPCGGLGAAGPTRVSAFIVCSPTPCFRAIATRRPSSLAELATVDGIGPTKLDLYGDEIIAVLDALA